MTRKEAIRQTEQADQLRALGFTAEEAEQLRRISMTLRRWHEMECGDGNEYGSWAIERDDNGDGPPFMVHHHYMHGKGKDTVSRSRIPDRETGAKKRLKSIIDARNRRVLSAEQNVCQNCGQWQHINQSNGGPLTIDCVNECIKRGLEPSRSVSAYIQTDPRGAALYIIRPGDVPEGANVDSYYTRGICVY